MLETFSKLLFEERILLNNKPNELAEIPYKNM